MRSVLAGLLVAILITNCGILSIRKPKNINQAIAYFERTWTRKQKSAFKNKTEKEALLGTHFGTGRWIRNHWIHGHRAPKLVSQLKGLSLRHPDDMSTLILVLLYRKLNNQPLGLEELSAMYKEDARLFDDKMRIEDNRVKDIYAKKSIGDTVKIYMYLDTSYGSRNAVIWGSAMGWHFNPDKDLLMQGRLLRKYFYNDTANAYFEVKIHSMNLENIQVLMKPLKPSDTFRFELRNMRVE